MKRIARAACTLATCRIAAAAAFIFANTTTDFPGVPLILTRGHIHTSVLSFGLRQSGIMRTSAINGKLNLVC